MEFCNTEHGGPGVILSGADMAALGAAAEEALGGGPVPPSCVLVRWDCISGCLMMRTYLSKAWLALAMSATCSEFLMCLFSAQNTQELYLCAECCCF